MKVGIVGGGQLARMLIEAASALGLRSAVLAASPDDAAAIVAAEVIIGAPTDPVAMGRLIASCDVVTFDHELVDLELLAELERAGSIIRPSSSSLRFAVDKAAMRDRLAAAQLPIPAYFVIQPGDPIELGALGAEWGWPLVIKAATGGYDGRGVFIAASADAAQMIVRQLHDDGVVALIEEYVDINIELAALVARGPDGSEVSWQTVETAQIDGVCREVLVPGSLSAELGAEAAELARAVADEVGIVGLLAVEIFATSRGLVINELAMRPHNSGHWTQDGSVTSQFENHLRAVLGLPLGETGLTSAAIASVNVFGSEAAPQVDLGLPAALAVPGAHVHLYGKQARPGRKLGHVTVCDGDPLQVRAAAWQAAVALGTPVPEEMEGAL